MRYLRTFLVYFLMVNGGYASEISPIIIEKQLVEISKSGLNRITMLPHHIIKILGDESKYKVEIDEKGSDIYIMPLCGIGEKIEISLKTSSNFSLDLELLVVEGRGKTIHLKRNLLIKSSKNILEIEEILKSMQLEQTGKYCVSDVNYLILERAGIIVKQHKTYKYQNIIGRILIIRNETTENILLSERQFFDLFANVKAVSIEGPLILLPNNILRVFVVSESDICNI
jgi:hypothetical protein